MPAWIAWYCGIWRYFSNSRFQASALIGGTTPGDDVPFGNRESALGEARRAADQDQQEEHPGPDGEPDAETTSRVHGSANITEVTFGMIILALSCRRRNSHRSAASPIPVSSRPISGSRRPESNRSSRVASPGCALAASRAKSGWRCRVRSIAWRGPTIECWLACRSAGVPASTDLPWTPSPAPCSFRPSVGCPPACSGQPVRLPTHRRSLNLPPLSATRSGRSADLGTTWPDRRRSPRRANASGHRVAVLPLTADDQLAVIDADSGTLLRTIQLGVAPIAAVVSADGTVAWVTELAGQQPRRERSCSPAVLRAARRAGSSRWPRDCHAGHGGSNRSR